jgi:hypothetical protein
MEIDPIARLSRLEALRRSGIPVGPESLSDGLEGADTPIAEDPVMSDEDKEAMFQRQANRIKTDDYRRERMLYRAAKATGTPVEELMQQPEWSGVGEARSDDNVMPMQARAAMAQKRMDDENARMDRWKSQMLLASSNSRANMSNAFGMLSPEQQQRVIESRLTGNRYNNNNDPRMAIAQLEAETRRAEGQDARAAAAENASAARQEGREEREAVRTAEELKYNARNAEEKMRHEGLMAQAKQRHEAMMAQMQAGNTAAAQAHATELAKITAMMQENKARNEATVAGQKLAADAQVESARINAGVLTEKIGATEQQLEEKAKQLAAEQQLAISERAFGPGVRDIAGKQYENPAAVETLSAIAKQANKSWTGFWEADAQRMDAILYRLGVTDPAVRHKLVEDHGLNARGTASVPSYYLHGTPRYATYATPAAP